MRIGKNNFINGLLAVFVISAIVLGCTCNDKEGFNWKDEGKQERTGDKTGDQTGDQTGNDSGSNDTIKADPNSVPSTEQSRAIVLRTLNDFNDAVKKGDFSDFRETVARLWRNKTGVDEFNKGFKQFIDNKIDISRINNSVPTFDPAPRIGTKSDVKVLFLKGEYPGPVKFNLEYIVEDDEWKLIFISVDTRRSR